MHELPPWSARTASAIARPIVRKVTPPYACLTSPPRMTMRSVAAMVQSRRRVVARAVGEKVRS